MTLTLEQAKNLIDYALTKLYTNYAALFDYNTDDECVSERCMVFHIGYYLIDILKKCPTLSSINVDAEYNRNFNTPKRITKNEKNETIQKTKNAIPDLLVHKRKSNDSNLICFEFKKGDKKLDENDRDKLTYFTSSSGKYNYQYGFYVCLMRNKKANIKVFKNGKEMGADNYQWKLSAQINNRNLHPKTDQSIMSIRSTAKAILYENGKILLNTHLTENGDTYHDLPGGGQHPYETMEEAVIREVREETGYIVKVDSFCAIAEEICDDLNVRAKYPDYSHRILHIFLVSIIGKDTDATQEPDYQQTGSIWVTPEEADTLNILPVQLKGKIKEIIRSKAPVYLGTVRKNENAD